MPHFHTVYDRKNTFSFKWDYLKETFQTDDVLPMWVADMDFQAPPAVNQAIKDRAKHGFYGYTVINEPIRASVVDWVKHRHDWKISQEMLSFSPGVIMSLHIALQTFTEKHDKILVQTPIYNPFFNIIENGEREIVRNSLVYKNGKYEIDFEDFENKLKQGVKAFIFCSPHNPVGRVWKKEELEKIAELCLAYDVLILSDEIHADLVFKNERHIPIATLSEEVAEQTITLMSPTKTFNLAGLQASYIITQNEEKRAEINKQLGLNGFNMLNTIGVIALKAAYNHSEQWLDDLLVLLEDHKHYVKETLESETNLKVIDSEGTYLLWIDCSDLELSAKELQQFMLTEAKVGMNPGAAYGTEGEQFMRMNIACPKPLLEEGVQRIITAINKRNK